MLIKPLSFTVLLINITWLPDNNTINIDRIFCCTQVGARTFITTLLVVIFMFKINDKQKQDNLNEKLFNAKAHPTNNND